LQHHLFLVNSPKSDARHLTRSETFESAVLAKLNGLGMLEFSVLRVEDSAPSQVWRIQIGCMCPHGAINRPRSATKAAV
jgi:hypothetical protein